TVSNNMIANLSGDGWNYTTIPTDNPIGIAVVGTQTGINIYHNSINLYGNTLNQTSAMSMGIYLATGSVATIKNNIIVNNLGLSSTTGYGAAGIYAATANSQLPGINYNNYWVNPTGSGNKYVGQIATTGQATFAGWQTASAGEAQGVNIQPQFTSPTDLHLVHANNATLDGKGTPIAGITTDIDEETRDASNPDVGADEFFACIPPSITTQPTNQSGCAGSDITLSVSATGTALTYQWRKASVNITGATSATYTINGATAGDAGNYDVVITGQCGNITSTVVTVTVDPITAITAQPVNQTACIGTSATFTVTAVGPSLGYQWRKNGVDIPGAITNVYTIASVAAGDVGNYDVVVAGTCGTATSNLVTLTIGSSLTITTQPTNQSACIGGTASFSVTASGGGLTYQWQKDGADISGATSSTLTINPVVAGSVGNYTVIINSSCGSAVTSNAASLSLSPATAITSQPQGVNVCANTGASFSVTATGSNLTYQWRKDGNPIGGATNSTYSIASVTTGDVGNYDVVVTGDCGSVTSSVAVLGFTNATAGVWLGSASSDWNSASNWCGGLPSTSTDVVISAGAPNMPTISGIANARRIQVNAGATVTITATGTLNVHGDYVNAGTMNANGTVVFQGGFSQNVQSLTAANVIMNTDYGIVLDGNLVVTNTLTLTKGIITTGNYTVTLNNSSAGSLASHIITSQNGVVIMNNVNAGPVVVPVAPDANSYNPITIANGQGRNYTVKVAAGIVPSIQNPSIAVNRTWGILAGGGALATPVNYTLQYADANANANANGAANMEVGLHNGTNWSVISAPAGVAPTGNAGARVINFASTQSGAFVLSNVGGTTAVPVIDADITSATLMPNVVNGRSVLRVNVRRAMKIDWAVTDMNGRVIMRFVQQLMPGQTDLPLQLGNLANGTYQLYGFTNKGKTQLLRFIKL
ncbi:MAG TPA: immunoglobulin domain-containing protein, partial [Chitinophagaceae bacterium]